MPHSSRFAGMGHLTFRVMGGKSGTIAATNGKKWQGERQKRQGWAGMGGDGRGFGCVHVAPPAAAVRCERIVWRTMRLFKVLAAPGGAVVIELKYHEQGGKSRGNLTLRSEEHTSELQ